MKKLLFAFIILIHLTGFSQKQNNIWYFGDKAGLDFNSGSPVALTNGAIFCYDNSATFSDANGNVLFYTNGVSVWNKNHITMPNGTGLLGSTTGGQTATIIPKPGSATLYYIFTVDAFAGPNGLCYSIVDMSLQGGNGDVTTKNVLLLNSCTEKVTATINNNGTDYWLVTHAFNSSSFYVYPVTSAGVGTPVVSSVGTIENGGAYNAMGQLEISPDHTKLALALYDTGNFEIYDFNASTGAVTNPIIIGGYANAWGVAFSPNSSVLYTTQWTYDAVYQFDLAAGSAANIAASALVVGNVTGTDPTYKVGYLQLGPDNKIYAAKYLSSYISAINNPNTIGLGCNFSDNAVYLAGKTSMAGFSNSIVLGCAFTSSIIDTITCFNDSTRFNLSSSANVNSISWNFGDPTSTNNTSTKLTTKHLFSSAGTYLVKAVVNTNCGIDTLKKSVTINTTPTPTATITGATTFCSFADTLRSNYFNTNQWYLNVTIITGATSQDYVPIQSGFYTVKVTDSAGCAGTSAFLSLTVLPSPTVNITCKIQDGAHAKLAAGCTYCQGSSVILAATGGGTYSWSTGDANDTTIVSPTNTTPYTVTVTAGNGCTATATQTVTINPTPAVPTIQLNAGILGSSSATGNQWYLNSVAIFGATGQFYTPTQSGLYSVSVKNTFGCIANSTVLNVILSGIDEQNALSNIAVYPNPSNGQINIDLSANTQGTIIVSLINTLGQTVYSNTLSSNKQIQLDLAEHISNGVYMLTLQSRSAKSTQRIVFEK